MQLTPRGQRVEAVLAGLAEHRFGSMVEQREREPGRREARWAHTIGEPAWADETARAAATTGRHRAFHDAVLAGDDRVGLVFEARVGDRRLQGWDYLRFDDAGRITEFTVPIGCAL